MLIQPKTYLVSIGAIIAVVTVAAVILVAVHPGSGAQSRQSASQADNAANPDLAGLTVDQKLDRSLSIPGIRGVIRGTVGSSTPRQLDTGEIVTDYQFIVSEALPKNHSPIDVGTHLTLRLPGGCVPTSNGRTLCTISEGAPQVSSGDELFVFVRDQGAIFGGNTNSRVVASSTADVLTVKNGLVHGQGSLAGFAEPVPTFERHFRS